MASRWQQQNGPRGDDYDERFRRLAASGHDIHGEASFLAAYAPTSVLDAGCGTGRVAIELHRRGVEVVGVDSDRSMLEVAVRKEPEIEWYEADLSALRLTDGEGALRTFDVAVTAGNVMIFLARGTERRTVFRLARHLVPGGRLIAGFQLQGGQYGLDEYDLDCADAGLELVARYATWDRQPWSVDVGYAVSVHQSEPETSEPETRGPETRGPEMRGPDRADGRG